MEAIGLVLVGLLAGLLAASLGIGGGIIFVTALVSFFGFAQLDAQGTSLAIIVPTTIIATIRHAKAGRVLWRIAAIAGTSGVAGALLGSRVAYVLDEDVLRRIFAVVLMVLAVRMGFRAWRLRPTASIEAD